ncbi:MAG: SCP2 sterol-binding domain-containing protein [Solirubrobacterales bacterium]
MRFARLIEEQSVEAAVDAAQVADGAGFSRVWMAEGEVDPREVAPAARMKRATIVLLLDAGADSSVPPGLPIELAVVGDSGWADALGALTGASPYTPPPPAWVVASNVGTVAEAARSGAGTVFESFENPDEAADWTAEYEAELGADSARAAFGRVNANCAVFVDAGDDFDELVGVVERYREAGVDEVILRGPAASDVDFVHRLIDEFDDAEVRQVAAERRRRRAPAIEKLEAAPAEVEVEVEVGTPAAGPRKRSGFAQRMQRFQDGAVRRLSDRQLEAMVGNRAAIPVFFRAMAGMYRPEKAAGFVGPIEFKIATPHGDELWTIDCTPSGATARRGDTPEAKLHVEAKLADFLRIGVGEIAAPSAVLSGKLNIRGDFALALRMGEMFGGPPIV